MGIAEIENLQVGAVIHRSGTVRMRQAIQVMRSFLARIEPLGMGIEGCGGLRYATLSAISTRTCALNRAPVCNWNIGD
jgi:hypothetical protein